MTLRFAHALAALLVALVALSVALVVADMPMWAWSLLALPIGASVARHGGILLSPRLGLAIGCLCGLGAFVVGWRAAQGQQVTTWGMGLLLALYVARMTSQRSLRHEMQALALSFAIFVAGALAQPSPVLVLALVPYLVAITAALTLGQLVAAARGEASPTRRSVRLSLALGRTDLVTRRFVLLLLGLSAAIVAVAVMLFISFPRGGSGQMLLGAVPNQLPDEVSLTGRPRAQGPEQVVARVTGLPYAAYLQGLYLRASLYDSVGTQGFTALPQDANLLRCHTALARCSSAVRRTYDVFVEPVFGSHLLTLGRVERIVGDTGEDAPPLNWRGPNEASEQLVRDQLTQPTRYRVLGYIAPLGSGGCLANDLVPPGPQPEGCQRAFERHFLALPGSLDPRIVKLATARTQGAVGPAQKAARLRQFLLEHFRYTLVRPHGVAKDPLAAFLFDNRQGHCEYFASAFAVLLRAVDVPARVVGGLQGGEWDPLTQTAVFTTAHAHAWVEWYMPARGWIIDDATPPHEPVTLTGVAAWRERMRRLWDDQLVSFGISQQLGLWRTLGQGLAYARRAVGPQQHQPKVVYGWIEVEAAITALVLFVGGAATWLWAQRRNHQALGRLGHQIELQLQAWGQPLISSETTLREAFALLADEVRTAHAKDVALLGEAINTYEAMRYGGYALQHEAYTLYLRLRRVHKHRA